MLLPDDQVPKTIIVQPIDEKVIEHLHKKLPNAAIVQPAETKILEHLQKENAERQKKEPVWPLTKTETGPGKRSKTTIYYPDGHKETHHRHKH